MSLLEKLRGELVDIVEWVDHTRDTLVWRFPRYHNQIKNGAELIVRPGQCAIFVHRGKLADVFEPGHYALTTQNLPILSTLQGWKHGFDSPFKSEVYFVNTAQVTDLKWGTPNPIMLRDPDFGPIRLRAFGTYTLKATNPKALLTELVGAGEAFEADEIQELMRAIIATAMGDMLGKSRIAALDLASNYETLSAQLREAVVGRVDHEYGLDVPQLYIVNISLPEEVEKALDTKTSLNVIGDLGRYQQYQMGQAMTAAAANPGGGGGAAAGMGIGMGMAMAQQMMHGAGGCATMTAPPPPPSTGGQVWHVAIEGQTQGPFTTQQLSGAIASGRIGRDAFVWTSGMTGWVCASQIPQLREASPPPPPAGQP
ncbi:MAG: SPFH domain-containing protein [Phycisphaerae bacterium]|nr:MAG: SPFH domain-containing protein [Planctomycetota bacterium]MBE7457674.1 SPFH domain-containing protein [Planctomycetia bacterium]MCK6463809.1 SPFH domain-containing protein [Phycisphaerae bacterium]MCL4717476.1 SPFH domain-containing protein [Phycisphaerae bacterium]MCQ3920273.1 antifreeze protein [Planctomycetota bacterium]